MQKISSADLVKTLTQASVRASATVVADRIRDHVLLDAFKQAILIVQLEGLYQLTALIGYSLSEKCISFDLGLNEANLSVRE